MDENEKEEAAKHAKQAAGQARAAAKETGKALRVATEVAEERIAEEARETAEKAEGTAEDALNLARRVNVNVLARLSGDTGVGFLALSVSIYAGAVAYAKFRQAFSESKHITGA